MSCTSCGSQSIAVPEIEDTYDEAAALREAARCYRCDAETGSADYSVLHREDIFSMARTNPLDIEKHRAMLQRRLLPRDNPFPEGRWPSLDDIVFLPANLSRLVIDPYREACRIDVSLGAEMPTLQLPFLVSGFDSVPTEAQQSLGRALQATGTGYVGKRCVAADIVWIQWIDDESSIESAATGYVVPWSQAIQRLADRKHDTFTGIAVSRLEDVEDAVEFALESNIDALFLDGVDGLSDPGKELSQQPRFDLLPRTVLNLRRRRQEEQVTLVYAGGLRSGTDAAKLIAMGATAVVYGVAAAIAAGGILDKNSIKYGSDRSMDERTAGVTALLQANAGEASMMARCTGKTRLHNLEPEDLRVVTLSSADMMGVPLAGTREVERSAER